MYEPGELSLLETSSIPLIPFPNLREHIGALAAKWFDHPTRHLDVYGVTGTNGKTSCSHYLAQSLMRLGQPCGVLGTIGVGFPDRLTPSV